MERTFKLAACAFTLLTLLSQVLPVSKRADVQSCPPIIASTSNHSTWLPVVHEGQDFHAWQQYTTAGYAEDLEVAWGRQPSSLRCSQFNITSAITDIHTLNTSIAVFDTRVDESCSDEGIYQVFISSNCTFNDNITFNMTFAKNDSCNKDTPPHPETPKSLAIPEPRPGTNDSTTLCVNIRYYGSKDISLYNTQWLLGEQGSCKDNDPNLLCEDDGIDEPGSVYTCDRIIFGNCTFLSDFCISNYSRVHSGNYTTIACPTSVGGPIGSISKLELSVIGWPELTEWPGSMNSPIVDVIGAKLTYGLTNFSHKFLNITFYNGSELIANLTHFADGYKVVIACEGCESTTIQLYIPAEGRYKMCYNFTYDVQWTGLSNFPPGYEVPNCTQYTHATRNIYPLLLGGTIGGALLLMLLFIIVSAIVFVGKKIPSNKRHPARDPDERSPLIEPDNCSINTNYGSHDGGQPLSHENKTEGDGILSSQDPNKACTGDENSVLDMLDDQPQHESDQSLSATHKDTTDDESYIQPVSTCCKDDGSTHMQETRSSSVEKGGDDGDESDHGGKYSTPEFTYSEHSTEQYVTKVDEVKHPQQECSLLTESHSVFLPDLEVQDEVKHSLDIPHPFTAEGPDVTMGAGELFRLSGNLKPQICSDDDGTQTLFPLPYEKKRPLRPVADQLNIPFIDPIEVLSCDTLGGFYNKHDVELMIPKGAVLPEEEISIEFGVSMYGPFKIADGRSVKRVSPVVWLCVQQEGFTGFQRDVYLTIPHFLDISTEDASRCLRFLKSDHQIDRLDENGEVEYQLRQADGRAMFDHSTKCTLVTRHFCLTCIASEIQPDKLTKYCLIGGKPKAVLKAQEWEIVFFICYFLKLCIWTVKKQMQNDNMQQIQPTKFMFPDGSSDIKLNIDTSNAQGWQLALESSNMISAEEVDFQSMTLEELRLSEDMKLYPPRFLIRVSGSAAAENSRAIFTFQGAIKTIVKEVILNKGGETIVQEATKACLNKRPKMNELFCIRDKRDRRIKLISTVQTNLTALGLVLDLDYAKIQSIEQRNHSQETSCTEILDHWLKGNGRTPVTWKTLLETLRDCDFMQLADDLEEALIDKDI